MLGLMQAHERAVSSDSIRGLPFIENVDMIPPLLLSRLHVSSGSAPSAGAGSAAAPSRRRCVAALCNRSSA